MNTGELQQQLFAEIKRKIGETASVADEIAKLLDISTDSAYRRIRGEKTVTLDELYTLCFHYKISLDQMMNIQTGSFMFQGNLLNPKTFRFDAYLTGIMHTMAYFNSFKEKEFYFLSKDLHVFYHFYIREIAAFKYYFWMKTLLAFPEFKDKKIVLDDYPDSLFELGQKSLAIYNQIDSYEVWNFESLNATIRQIEYYRDNRMFESDEDVLRVYEALEKLLDHLEKQAELGYKFQYGDPQKKPIAKIQMYLNEILLLDNSMLLRLDETKLSLVIHTVSNFMMTRDLSFCENSYQYIKNLLQRSTLISEVSEKERTRFFRIIRERITKRKEALKV